jgi:hypothetical protein
MQDHDIEPRAWIRDMVGVVLGDKNEAEKIL